MIYGIGVDLVNVKRMERVLASRIADRFVSRVFAAEEAAICRQSARPAESFAARFAAKEAVVKALGTGFSHGVSPGMIVVRGGERSRPHIELKDRALDKATSAGITSIHVSLTHTPTDACAFVVAECSEMR